MESTEIERKMSVKSVQTVADNLEFSRYSPQWSHSPQQTGISIFYCL